MLKSDQLGFTFLGVLRLPEQGLWLHLNDSLPHDIDHQVTSIHEQASIDILDWLAGIAWNAERRTCVQRKIEYLE